MEWCQALKSRRSILSIYVLSTLASGLPLRAQQDETLSVVIEHPNWGLSHYSQFLYGKASRWPELARLNNLQKPYLIKIGQTIQIPEPRILSPEAGFKRVTDSLQGKDNNSNAEASNEENKEIVESVVETKAVSIGNRQVLVLGNIESKNSVGNNESENSDASLAKEPSEELMREVEREVEKIETKIESEDNSMAQLLKQISSALQVEDRTAARSSAEKLIVEFPHLEGLPMVQEALRETE